MKPLAITGFLLIATFLCMPVSGGDDKIVTRLTVPNFASLEDKAALDAMDAIVADHRAMEQELTSQLDSKTMPAKRKVLLIYALGQLRSVWAVPSLVKIVDFPAPFRDPASDTGRWGQYPVVNALTSIGDRAVDRIIEIIPAETDPLRLRLFFTVIHQVEGSKGGRIRLTEALAKANSDVAKRNLQRALGAFDSYVAPFDKEEQSTR